MEDPIAVITPSPSRRVISVGIVMALGGMVLYLAFATPPTSGLWQGFLVLIGVTAIIGGDKMRRATALTIVMTRDAIFDSSGRELCRMDDIVGIDRGAFAFKPANGFLLSTRTRLGRSWSPGLWWRLGRRIGVGGATGRGQSKFMAEAIAAHIAQAARD